MIDIDEIERLINLSKIPCAPVSGSTALELIAEIRRLRARLEIDPRHSYDGIACRDETILQQGVEIVGLREDADRLDYLDARNDRKNHHNGTRYGWGLTENHNRIALEDHHFPVLTVREAIDAARKDPK